ncbi:MAG: fumarylacetoacetate hydrolase family protein [Firmicutes bacterium]|nr:fumarylacetoacetate hydrolase family protein [Bacillota bacterium]
MGVPVVRYRYRDQAYWGVLKDEEVAPFADGGEPTSAIVARGPHQLGREAANAQRVPFHDVTPLSPVTRPSRIFCQGVNYSAHRREAGMSVEKPAFNLFFMKADSALSGAFDAVIRPPEVELLDYEIELGLLLRGPVVGPIEVTTANLADYVAGLFIANDVSARDIQVPQGQWFYGKSFRTFCPVGPVLYLWDAVEAASVHELELRLWVNGELRQSASTTQLLYGPEESLTQLSRAMDWETGDVLLTGTPGGVALTLSPEILTVLNDPSLSGDAKQAALRRDQRQNGRYLKPGDLVEAEIRDPNGTIALGRQRFFIVGSGE